MAEFDNMLRSLPVAYRTDKWVCDLLGSIQSLDDTQRAAMLDTAAQLYPDSMTWLLETEERAGQLAVDRHAGRAPHGTGSHAGAARASATLT